MNRNSLKYYIGFSVAVFLALILFLSLTGDFNGEPGKESTAILNDQAGEKPEEKKNGAPEDVITDTNTEANKIQTNEISQLDSNMEVFNIYKDGMMRGEKYPEKGVADVSYYEDNSIQRGDLVMLDIPIEVAYDYTQGDAGTSMGRIIGLPGETIKIENGQIFVNDRKLDTFYGKVYEWPLSGQVSRDSEDQEGGIDDEHDVAEFQIPEDSFFIRGDNWRLSRVGLKVDEEKEIVELTSIPEKFIRGKVIGYYGNEVDEPEEKQEGNTNPEEVITDPDTEEWLRIVEPGPNMIVEMVQSNGMVKPNGAFWDKEMVIDPEYYAEKEIKRGDIVKVTFPEKKLPERIQKNIKDNRTISRVIGLPGETVKIEDGQLYIDGKMLDTFYGEAMSWGVSEEEYTGDGLEDYFDQDKPAVHVPENHIYVLNDTWWRGLGSNLFGPLPTESIIGKVLGYTNFDPLEPAYTSVEVRDLESDELVKEITDKELLEELDKQLKGLKGVFYDLESNPPDYKLVIKKDGDVLKELYYYKEPVKIEPDEPGQAKAGPIEGQYVQPAAPNEVPALIEATLDLPVP